MTARIRITFHGDVPGLAEHRLSLVAFEPALKEFLRAARRIASGITRDALGNPNYGAKGGKISDDAAKLDVAIEAVRDGGCTQLLLALSMMAPTAAQGPQLKLFEHIPGETARVMMSAVRDEAEGKLRNAAVRKYLRALPQGLTKQAYALMRGDVVEEGFELGAPDAPIAAPPSRLIKLVGHVSGVAFEPGEPRVEIRTPKKYTCVATARQVEIALDLRGRPVEALALFGRERRLLWLVEEGQAEKLILDANRRKEEILDRWAEVLKRLAK